MTTPHLPEKPFAVLNYDGDTGGDVVSHHDSLEEARLEAARRECQTDYHGIVIVDVRNRTAEFVKRCCLTSEVEETLRRDFPGWREEQLAA